MPVFDKSTKVGRNVSDPGSDKSLPDGKSLSYGAMPSSGGLAGATGVDCKLVHGDRWQQIDGNFTEQTNSNVKTTILADETRNVVVRLQRSGAAGHARQVKVARIRRRRLAEERVNPPRRRAERRRGEREMGPHVEERAAAEDMVGSHRGLLGLDREVGPDAAETSASTSRIVVGHAGQWPQSHFPPRHVQRTDFRTSVHTGAQPLAWAP